MQNSSDKTGKQNKNAKIGIQWYSSAIYSYCKKIYIYGGVFFFFTAWVVVDYNLFNREKKSKTTYTPAQCIPERHSFGIFWVHEGLWERQRCTLGFSPEVSFRQSQKQDVNRALSVSVAYVNFDKRNRYG